MYCKKCGHELTDDAIFCSQCGTRTDTNSAQINNDEQKTPIQENQSGSGCSKTAITFAILMLVIVISLIVTFFPNTNSKNSSSHNNKNTGGSTTSDTTDTTQNYVPSLFTRKANWNDMVIDFEWNWSSLSTDMIITPNTDIDDLSIQLSFYDKNENLLCTTSKYIGNVKEGVQITKKISLSEFAKYIFSIDHTTPTITSGSVSYFK